MPFGPATSTKSIFGFDPTIVADCALWLDASDLTSFTLSPGTTNVTAWRDKSPRAASFTGNSSPVFVANAVNGRSAVNLTGVNFFNGSVSNGLNVLSVFVVATMNSSTDSFGRLISTTGDNVTGSTLILRRGTGQAIYAVANGNEIPRIDTYNFVVPAYGTAFVYDYVINGLYPLSYANGSSPLIPVAVSSANFTYTTCFIGRNAATSSGFWNGYICEILFFNSTLTDVQREQIEGYLGWKWGVAGQFPLTHPYRASAITSQYFLPTSINGCVAWFDAADTSTVNVSGTTVVRWKDKSGNGNDATPGTGPTYTTDASSRRCLSFNGTNQTLVSSARVPTHTHCLIAVWAPTTVTATSTGNTSLFRFQSSGFIVFPYMQSSTARGYISSYDGTTTGSTTSVLVENSVAGQINACIANISQNSQQIFKNGTLQSSGAGVMTTFALSDTLTIGSFGTTTEFFQGNLFEMIIYDTTLTTTQRQMIEGYLAWKWNIRSSLVSTNRFLTFQPSAALPFVPTQIPNCRLWLDGADPSPTSMTFSAGTSNITVWRDKSGNGYNATATGSPVFLSNAINGVAAVRFNNGPYFLGDISGMFETFTCFAVAVTDAVSTSPDQRLVSLSAVGRTDYQTASSAIALFIQTTTAAIQTYRNLTNVASNAVSANVPFLAVSQYNGTNGFMFVNGRTGTFSGTASTGTFNITRYGIGNAANVTSEFWRGSIGEVLLYSTALSPTERQFVEGYLSKKWNIRLIDSNAYAMTIPSSFPDLNYNDIPGMNVRLDCSIYISWTTSPIAFLASNSGGNAWEVYNLPSKISVSKNYSAIVLNSASTQYLMDQIGVNNTGAYTIEVWFYVSFTTNMNQTVNIVGEMGQSGAPYSGYNWTVIQLRNRQIQIGPYTFNNLAGLNLGTYFPGRWYQVVLTNSANGTSTLTGYVNGAFVASASYTRSAPAASYYTLGGPANNNNTYFNGYIGFYRNYSFVLNATQVKQNYNSLCERYGLSIIP